LTAQAELVGVQEVGDVDVGVLHLDGGLHVVEIGGLAAAVHHGVGAAAVAHQFDAPGDAVGDLGKAKAQADAGDRAAAVVVGAAEVGFVVGGLAQHFQGSVRGDLAQAEQPLGRPTGLRAHHEQGGHNREHLPHHVLLLHWSLHEAPTLAPKPCGGL
jgi:hypothetical protein